MGASESKEDNWASPAGKAPIMAGSKWDPRSPSDNVKRTPIRGKQTSWDPRSPSNDVNRTPLQLQKSGLALEDDVRVALSYENDQKDVESGKKDGQDYTRVALLDKNVQN